MCQCSCLPTFAWGPHCSRDYACSCCHGCCSCSFSLGSCLLSSCFDIRKSSSPSVSSTADRCTWGNSRFWFWNRLALDNKRRSNFWKLNLKEERKQQFEWDHQLTIVTICLLKGSEQCNEGNYHSVQLDRKMLKSNDILHCSILSSSSVNIWHLYWPTHTDPFDRKKNWTGWQHDAYLTQFVKPVLSAVYLTEKINKPDALILGKMPTTEHLQKMCEKVIVM